MVWEDDFNHCTSTKLHSSQHIFEVISQSLYSLDSPGMELFLAGLVQMPKLKTERNVYIQVVPCKNLIVKALKVTFPRSY